MKISAIRRISKESLKSKDVPKWVGRLLTPLNDFIEKVVSALQGRLTFEDNFSGMVETYEFAHDVPTPINPQNGRLRVTGVLPLYSSGAVVTGFGWDYAESGASIDLTFEFADEGEHDVKVLILYGVN